MAIDIGAQTYFIVLSGNVFTIPRGFTAASVTNDGAADMVLTNSLGQTYALKEGETFEWKNYGTYFNPIEIDATATTGRLAYFDK